MTAVAVITEILLVPLSHTGIGARGAMHLVTVGALLVAVGGVLIGRIRGVELRVGHSDIAWWMALIAIAVILIVFVSGF